MLFLIALIIALVLLPWPWGLALVAAGLAGEALLAMYGFRYTRHWRPRVGVELLVGQSAEAITPLDPEGQVKLNGEIWAAHARTPIRSGASVRVDRVDGLVLTVSPSDSPLP
jgi:membrane-bound serine protease (ClpP class)